MKDKTSLGILSVPNWMEADPSASFQFIVRRVLLKGLIKVNIL